MPESPPSSPATFYVTTPIYYVNARPHIGHAYTTVAADVLARRHRLLGDDVFFLTGTDEHGQKIERSARAAGIDPQTFADHVAASFRSLWDRMGITYTDFIRTTEPRHKQRVQHLFRELQSRGAIYKSTYTGQYCVHDEAYVDGPPGIRCPDCGRVTETVSEENFYFRLSLFQQPLLDLLEPGPNGDPPKLQIQPDSRRNEVLSFVRGGLKDLSISRTSFSWGIPVPGDEKHVIYVWLDALANYMTAIGYGSDAPADQALFHKFWPADLHLVGKEIIRFHCVYWPAFLLALNPALHLAPPRTDRNEAGAPRLDSETWVSNPPQLSPEQHHAWAQKMLPRAVTAHGWLLFEESKMSKSRGNIVRTETILDTFGDHFRRGIAEHNAQQLKKDPAFQPTPDPSKSDADLFASDVLRYFLLREIPFGQDGSFSFDALIERYNADLANGYGNLVSRTLSMIERNLDGTLPASAAITPPEAAPLISHAAVVAREAAKDFTSSHFTRVTTSLASFIGMADTFFSGAAPWKLAKSSDPADRDRLAAVLYTAAESIRIITALLYPILPFSTARVWSQLGLGSIEAAATRGDLRNLAWGGLPPGTRLGPLAPIFPRAPKELAQIMTDIEAQTPRTSSPNPQPPDDLTAVTADTDAATSAAAEFPRAPLSSETPAHPEPATPAAEPNRSPTPSRLSNETLSATAPVPTDPWSPGAPPRTSVFSSANPIAEVGGSIALDPVFQKTPSHTEARASGLFAGNSSNRPIPQSISGASEQPPPATSDQPPTGDVAPFAPQITIDDFVKLDLRVARILVAERIPKADKLLRLEVDLGSETRQILSGIAPWYTPEELVGRRIVVIANLAPRKMRGLDSHGMLLAASYGEDGKPVLATFADSDDIPPGARLK